jgi:cell volume regulation protein A
MIDLTLLFLISGSIIVVGFLGNLAYEKAKIPDVLFLLGVGVLLGPVFNVVRPGHLADFAEPFGTFALIVILFEGGMDIKIRMLLKEFGNATLLVFLAFTLTVAGITLFLIKIMAWDLMRSLLMATILGCTSSAIVVPVLAKMSIGDDTKTVLFIESAMSDVLAIVLAVTLVEFIRFEAIGIEKPMRAIASSFSIAIVLGTFSGFLWFKLLNVIGNRQYAYMVTLGAMLIVVAVVDFLGGSGPIAILIFGILLGNCESMPFFRGIGHCALIDETIKFFHGEVTFFIRTFFFVYMGMIITADVLDPRYLVVSFLLMLIIAAARYVSVESMVRLTGREKSDKAALFYMLPRGLASAVLASFPVSAGLKGSRDFILYAVLIIIFSNIIMTSGVFLLERKRANDRDETAAAPEAP